MTRQTLTPLPGAEIRYDDDGEPIVDVATCGACGRSWNDAAVSAVTPTPAGRCPFEYEHGTDNDDVAMRNSEAFNYVNDANENDILRDIAAALDGHHTVSGAYFGKGTMRDDDTLQVNLVAGLADGGNARLVTITVDLDAD